MAESTFLQSLCDFHAMAAELEILKRALLRSLIASYQQHHDDETDGGCDLLVGFRKQQPLVYSPTPSPNSSFSTTATSLLALKSRQQ